jgi:hypothetical protein
MADGIDAAVHRVQPSRQNLSSHRRPVVPERGELWHGHDTVLTSRQLSKRGSFVSHTDT